VVTRIDGLDTRERINVFYEEAREWVSGLRFFDSQLTRLHFTQTKNHRIQSGVAPDKSGLPPRSKSPPTPHDDPDLFNSRIRSGKDSSIHLPSRMTFVIVSRDISAVHSV